MGRPDGRPAQTSELCDASEGPRPKVIARSRRPLVTLVVAEQHCVRDLYDRCGRFSDLVPANLGFPEESNGDVALGAQSLEGRCVMM